MKIGEIVKMVPLPKISGHILNRTALSNTPQFGIFVEEV